VYGESYVARLTDAQEPSTCSLRPAGHRRYDGHKTTIFQNVNIDRGPRGTAPRRERSTSPSARGWWCAARDGSTSSNSSTISGPPRRVRTQAGRILRPGGVPRLSRDMAGHLGQFSGRAMERYTRTPSTRRARPGPLRRILPRADGRIGTCSGWRSRRRGALEHRCHRADVAAWPANMSWGRARSPA